MPELPEVEVTVREIRDSIVHQTIKFIKINNFKLRSPIPSEIATLSNLKVLDVCRRAKYIIISTDKGYFLIHLGMSGKLWLTKKDLPLRKHDHVEIILDKCDLRLNDARRFGLFLYFKTKEELNACKFIANLGIEPLDEAFDANYLLSHLHKNTLIKIDLMNGKIVVGIGNIYASEVLFKAGVLPTHKGGAITLDQAKKIVQAIKDILPKAIAMGGTTIRDFSGADGKAGEFATFLQVYNRKGESCPKCGATIEQLVISNRSTYFCPNCQH